MSVFLCAPHIFSVAVTPDREPIVGKPLCRATAVPYVRTRALRCRFTRPHPYVFFCFASISAPPQHVACPRGPIVMCVPPLAYAGRSTTKPLRSLWQHSSFLTSSGWRWGWVPLLLTLGHTVHGWHRGMVVDTWMHSAWTALRVSVVGVSFYKQRRVQRVRGLLLLLGAVDAWGALPAPRRCSETQQRQQYSSWGRSLVCVWAMLAWHWCVPCCCSRQCTLCGRQAAPYAQSRLTCREGTRRNSAQAAQHAGMRIRLSASLVWMALPGLIHSSSSHPTRGRASQILEIGVKILPQV